MEGPLTPLYTPWIKDLLVDDLPIESKATCSECAMCPAGDEPFAGLSFHVTSKCCTYFPKLPNYLVGRLLDDPDAAFGQEKVRGFIASGQASPIGVLPDYDYSLRYDHHEFGRNHDMRCPYFVLENGNCGLWRSRPATCQTWFCKSDRGEVGANLWRTLNALLNEVENALTDWCLLQLDVPVVLEKRLPESKIDPTVFPEYDWGPWADDKEGFYRRCFALVNSLDWAGVVQACGATVALLARRAVLAYQRYQSDEIPPVLYPGAFSVNALDEEGVNLATYSPYDPLQLPMAMFRLLHYFDGRPFAAIHAEILEKEGLDLPLELIRMLLDFEIIGGKPPKHGTR